jgi:APA family basic amino acid/polyamine antiporter
MTKETTQLIRGLGLIAAISVNVANIIGTGVFLKARVMTCNVGTPGKALVVWVFAGLLALAGALTYAELLAMMPRAAGEYGIIRDAYGRLMGWIYGWTQFMIARTASAAALAVGFAIFLNDLVGGSLKHTYWETNIGGFPLSFNRLQIIAIITIIVTTLINCAAVNVSGGVASVLTGLKIILLIGVGLGAFLYSGGDWGNLSQANNAGICEGVAVTTGGLAGFAAAMLGALWAYDGWNNVTFLAGEVKDPG